MYKTPYFPHPIYSQFNELLCVGAMLDADTVLMAYSHGIFPWFEPGTNVEWYFTNPRCVLIPAEIKIAKSMRSILRSDSYRITRNQAFAQVMRACKTMGNREAEGTWIGDEIQEVFLELHQRGFAHSIEVWEGAALVGGLYGMQLGKVFFGESMFAKKSNMSKLALIHLCQSNQDDLALIDCQQITPHLISMGAQIMPGMDFYQLIQRYAQMEYLKK